MEDAAGDVLWGLADHEGTIRDIVDSTGTVQEHRQYDTFGQITSPATPTADFPQAFTGRPLDADTGLYDYRARWYDPAVGRFVSEDPSGFAGGDANLYRYAGNSPVIYVDPSGLSYEGVSRQRTRPGLQDYLDAIRECMTQFDTEYDEFRRTGRINDEGSALTAAAKRVNFGAAKMGNIWKEFGLTLVDLHNGFAEWERNLWVDWGFLPESSRFHLPNYGKAAQGIDDRLVAGENWADIALQGEWDAFWMVPTIVLDVATGAIDYAWTGDPTQYEDAIATYALFTALLGLTPTDGVITPTGLRPVQITPTPLIERPVVPVSPAPVARSPVDPYTLQVEQLKTPTEIIQRDPLDWSIVKKSTGETRWQHIQKHATNNQSKPFHGVFDSDPVLTTQEAWYRAQRLGVQPDATGKYVVPMGRRVGWEGGASGTGAPLEKVTIITTDGTKIITAYPSR